MMKYSKETILSIDPNKLKQEHLSRYIYWRWYYDLVFFSNYFLSHYKQDKKTGNPIRSAPFHSELTQLLIDWKDLLVICPRDHAKSTNLFFYLMWCIAYKQEKAVLLIMSAWLWTVTIWKIRDEFETNERLKSIFT